MLAYASDAPPDLHPVRKPPTAIGGAFHAEAKLVEPACVGLQVIGGRAVVDKTSARAQRCPPASEVVPGILRVQKGHELGSRSRP